MNFKPFALLPLTLFYVYSHAQGLEFTDDVGSDDNNLRLSQNRAQAVVDYLIGKGIEKTRVLAKGYGETRPVAGNDAENGKQLNRRVEFKILKS